MLKKVKIKNYLLNSVTFLLRKKIKSDEIIFIFFCKKKVKNPVRVDIITFSNDWLQLTHKKHRIKKPATSKTKL